MAPFPGSLCTFILPLLKSFVRAHSPQYRYHHPRTPLQKNAIQTFLSPDAVKGLGAATGAVLALGVVEGIVLTAGSSAPAGKRAYFSFRYGLHQMMPSIIWATRCPRLVAEKIGQCPKGLVTDLPTVGNRWRVEGLFTARSIIAGFVGISQIL